MSADEKIHCPRCGTATVAELAWEDGYYCCECPTLFVLHPGSTVLADLSAAKVEIERLKKELQNKVDVTDPTALGRIHELYNELETETRRCVDAEQKIRYYRDEIAALKDYQLQMGATFAENIRTTYGPIAQENGRLKVEIHELQKQLQMTRDMLHAKQPPCPDIMARKAAEKLR